MTRNLLRKLINVDAFLWLDQLHYPETMQNPIFLKSSVQLRIFLSDKS